MADDENRASYINSSKRKTYSESALQHALDFSTDSAKDKDDDMVDSDASDVVHVLEKSKGNAEFVSEFVLLKELRPLADKPERRARFRVPKIVSV
jgi:hypothetical protein